MNYRVINETRNYYCNEYNDMIEVVLKGAILYNVEFITTLSTCNGFSQRTMEMARGQLDSKSPADKVVCVKIDDLQQIVDVPSEEQYLQYSSSNKISRDEYIDLWRRSEEIRRKMNLASLKAFGIETSPYFHKKPTFYVDMVGLSVIEHGAKP